MITANKIKERFDLYRKWFKTLIYKEFINLPHKEQGRFISMLKASLLSCEQIHTEAKGIKEKAVIIKVDKIIRFESSYQIIGYINDSTTIAIDYPQDIPEPELGSSISCIIFSKDEVEWFSSKKELITGRT